MTEPDRIPHKFLEAVHAQLFGVLADIEAKTAQIHTDLPAARDHVNALVGDVRQAFEETSASTIALVGWVKRKQIETLGEINAAHSKVTADTHKVLSGFERMLWAIGTLTIVNTLLLFGHIFLSK